MKGGFSSHLWNSLPHENSLVSLTVCNVKVVYLFFPHLSTNCKLRKTQGEKGNSRISTFELTEFFWPQFDLLALQL